MTTQQATWTVELNNGLIVAAKFYHGELYALTYANRTQAEKACTKLGQGWEVYHSPRYRPFYIALTAPLRTDKEG